MPGAVLIDQNVIDGVQNSKVLSGVNNLDPGTLIERGFLLPYVREPRSSWLDYRCSLSILLDPGIVLHKILPQSIQQIDTLASGTFDPEAQVGIPLVQIPFVGVVAVPNHGNLQQVNFNQSQPYDENVNQANTVSAGRYTDFAQRMATSEYHFVLKGWAIRAGYKIPIPGLKTVCGVPAVPEYPQEVLSDSEVIANYSGVPIFFSQWNLRYFITVPPKSAQLPPPNVSEHIRADAPLPTGMQVPYSQPDSLAVTAGSLPTALRGK